MTSLLLDPFSRATDDNGKVLSGAKLYIFDAGTTTDAETYLDKDLVTQHPQPVVADSAGRFANIFIPAGQFYKLVLKTSADVDVFTRDDIPPAITNAGGALPHSAGGTNATSAAAALTSLGAASSSDVSTLSTDVATVKGQLDNVGGTLGAVAAKASIAPTDLADGFDRLCIQEHEETFNTETSVSSTTIGLDDTIPQSSEGTELMSFTFTPTRTDSKIAIWFQLPGLCNSGSGCNVIAALFTNLSNDALVATADSFGNQERGTLVGYATLEPGSTSTLTISIRAGITTGPFVFNKDFSTANRCVVVVQELINTPKS